MLPSIGLAASLEDGFGSDDVLRLAIEGLFPRVLPDTGGVVWTFDMPVVSGADLRGARYHLYETIKIDAKEHGGMFWRMVPTSRYSELDGFYHVTCSLGLLP